MKLQSGHAVLDVKRGRVSLLKACEERHKFIGTRIPVTITGFVVGEHSAGDGVSTEFTVEVESAEVVLHRLDRDAVADASAKLYHLS